MLLGRGAGGPICSSWRREASKRFGMYFARRSGVVEPQDDAVDQGETDGEPAVRAASTNLPAAAGGLQPPCVDTPISQGRNGCMWVPKGIVQGFPRVLCARVLCRVGLCGSVVALDHSRRYWFYHMGRVVALDHNRRHCFRTWVALWHLTTAVSIGFSHGSRLWHRREAQPAPLFSHMGTSCVTQSALAVNKRPLACVFAGRLLRLGLRKSEHHAETRP